MNIAVETDENNPMVCINFVDRKYFDSYHDFLVYEDAKNLGIVALTKHLTHLCFVECRTEFDREDRDLSLKNGAKALYDLTKDMH
jgi:hypothetical protein